MIESGVKLSHIVDLCIVSVGIRIIVAVQFLYWPLEAVFSVSALFASRKQEVDTEFTDVYKHLNDTKCQCCAGLGPIPSRPLHTSTAECHSSSSYTHSCEGHS